MDRQIVQFVIQCCLLVLLIVSAMFMVVSTAYTRGRTDGLQWQDNLDDAEHWQVDD